jgi:hypothetical protein
VDAEDTTGAAAAAATAAAICFEWMDTKRF